MCKARGRIRYQNNSKRVVRNLEGRKVGTKTKSPKQVLTNGKDLTIMLSEGSDSPYHRSDKNNLPNR